MGGVLNELLNPNIVNVTDLDRGVCRLNDGKILISV